MVSTKMYPSYRVDEGYSEDTRSQDDLDSPMRMESGADDMLQIQIASDAAMALNDGEKGGKSFSTLPVLREHLTDISRTRIQYPPYSQSLIHSLGR